MAVDYYGSFDCKVRQAVDDETLSSLEKARNRANVVVERMRSNPDTDRSIPEAEWKFRVVVMGASGPQEQEMRIGDLLEECKPLDELSVHCTNCVFNVRQKEFGCGGAINYPVSKATEKWLIDQLPEDISGKVGKLLLQTLKASEFDGKAIDDARSRSDLYELSRPLERKWGGMFSSQKVNTSQLFELLFAVGTLTPVHASLVGYFFGCLTEDLELVERTELDPFSEADPGIRTMKFFLRTVALAGANKTSVYIDA